jgi:hypothetical protein
MLYWHPELFRRGLHFRIAKTHSGTTASTTIVLQKQVSSCHSPSQEKGVVKRRPFL